MNDKSRPYVVWRMYVVCFVYLPDYFILQGSKYLVV